MSTRNVRLLVLCGSLIAGVVLTGGALQAHHAVAGVYDLNKEGKVTEWKLTTASIQVLTREGINKTSMKPGEALKVTILPAKNGNPAGFIRNLQLGDRNILLFFGDGTD
jgi:hypothetical protein